MRGGNFSGGAVVVWFMATERIFIGSLVRNLLVARIRLVVCFVLINAISALDCPNSPFLFVGFVLRHC